MKLKEQPLLFSSALLLSLIGGSIAITICWLIALFYTQATVLIESYTNIQSMDQVSPLYFFILGALSLLSVVGIIKLGKWQKAGYFFYTGAQLGLLMVPLIWIGANAFSSTNSIFTILFIGIYTAFYKALK